MSRLTNLLARLRTENPALAEDLETEISALTDRRSFGLNFERHVPEAVELVGRKVRRGDKVRVLPPRGEQTPSTDERLWKVIKVDRPGGTAFLESVDPVSDDGDETAFETAEAPIDNLVVVAEFRDPIYPGLLSNGKVERDGDRPFHTVINAENYHALQTLLFAHRGTVDAIYIDPPYNTGAKDWKYNNDYVEGEDLYRHSKWLAFMERRLLLAKELLNPDDSVLIVTIDEKEYLRLGMLLEQVFEGCDIQMVSSLINPAGVARQGGFSRTDEYVFVVRFGNAKVQRVMLDREWVSGRGRTHRGNLRWDMLRRSSTNAERSHSPGCFYPIYVDPDGPKVHSIGLSLPPGDSVAEPVDGMVAVLPIRRNGTEGNWQWAPATFEARLAQGRVRVSGNLSSGFVISVLKEGEFAKIERGEYTVTGYRVDGSVEVADIDTTRVLATPGSQWRIGSHDSTQYGSRLIAALLPDRKFPFPKSLYAVEDVLRFFVTDKPDALVIDFFAGSGTTAHAVMRLNRQDGGRRRSVLVTNNEVSETEARALAKEGRRPGDPEWEALGIFEHITRPRIEAAVTGLTHTGEPVAGDYKFTDEFPMADGFEENVEFFTLTYESPLSVASNREFSRIAPLIWMRAGATGRRIEDLSKGWDVAEAYGVLVDLDLSDEFVRAVAARGDGIRAAFIVTDEDRVFESVARGLPDHVEAVRLYESYLRNFEIESGRGA